MNVRKPYTLLLLDPWEAPLLNFMLDELYAMAQRELYAYTIQSGTASDAYHVDRTYTTTSAWRRVDVLVEGNAAVISFRDLQGNWGSDKSLPVGFYSFDFVCTGAKIKNRSAGNNADFEFTFFSEG